MTPEPVDNVVDEVVGVYLTFPNEEVAASTASALVAGRLAACVNIWPAVRSVYRWQGEVVTEGEVVAWAKTTKGRLPQLVALVKEMHPYELPCVVAYSAVAGSEDFLRWVREEVTS